MNKHAGFIFADFMSILALGLLIFMHQPKNQPVRHEVVRLSDDAKLIRVVNGVQQLWHGARWRHSALAVDQMLLIECDQSDLCARQFSATNTGTAQLIMALPSENLVAAANLVYNECAINGRCTNLLITHDKSTVKLTTANPGQLTHTK
jgi:hypothetical protein